MTRHPRNSPLIATAALSVLLGVQLGTAFANEDRTEAAAAEPAAKRPLKLLDLRAPDITRLYTSQQIQMLLAKTFNENLEGVEVEGQRDLPPPNTPSVWGAIAAPFWALLHPTQAWRIIAPLPPDQARRMNNDAPDATSTYIEPAAPTNP